MEETKKNEGTALVVEGEEGFSKKPKGKPEQAISGKLLIWPNEKKYYFEGNKARPELKQEVVLDKKDVRIAKTAGEKEQSYILKVKCSSDVENPESVLLHKAIKALGDKCKGEPQFSKPNFLIDRPEEIQAWVRQKEKRLRVLLNIDLSLHQEKQLQRLNNLTGEIYKLIYKLK